MATIEIDNKTVAILKKDEFRYLAALWVYNKDFDSDRSRTFNYSAHKAGVNTAYLVDYMFWKKELRICMPETTDDALNNLKNIENLVNSLDLKEKSKFYNLISRIP